MPKNRRIVLAARPDGFPKESDFAIVESDTPRPAEGECLVEGLYLSVDPYMRGRMREGKSYAPPLAIGETIVGGVVGRVVESRSPAFIAGDIAFGDLGWTEYAAAPAAALRKVDPNLAPISTALGVLGMPGLTAYFGLLDVCDPQPGETVLVSGAAGAVGSLVGQIAKIRGCRAVGVAGTDEKVAWLTAELGFDAAFNYKRFNRYGHKLDELCPEGVDCYFDNTGGPLTDEVFPRLRRFARVAVCGQIDQYNDRQAARGPRLLWHLIVKQAKAEGFLVFQYERRYAEGLARMAGWLRDGRLHYRETVSEGIESAPRAFIGMLRGENIGKQIVKLA